MLPDFSKPTFSFFALGGLRFRTRHEGGGAGPFRSDYRCQLRYADDLQQDGVEARVYFVGRETAAAGDELPIVVAFLDWENQRGQCRVGRKFELCEGASVTATGIVEAIAGR
jgi:hypothetical protein